MLWIPSSSVIHVLRAHRVTRLGWAGGVADSVEAGEKTLNESPRFTISSLFLPKLLNFDPFRRVDLDL